jgi:hypothetical protein
MLRIAVAGRTLKAEVNSKSLCKAVTQVTAADSPDQFAVVLRGKLEADAVIEAGIVAQEKVAKPAMAA